MTRPCAAAFLEAAFRWAVRLALSFASVSLARPDGTEIPLEVTYFHYQTTRGWGGNQPKIFSDQIQLRVYTRLFGG